MSEPYDFEYALTDDQTAEAIASCGVVCPYHDGVPHAPCCELDRPRMFRAVPAHDSEGKR